MPHGGARPGAGHPPTNFYAPIDYLNGQPVSIMDRVEEALRQGAFLHDAAARIGQPVEQLREWRKIGVRVGRALIAGTKRLHDLTVHERQCGELALRMERAEAEGRMHLLALAQRQARGGLKRTEVTSKVVGSTLNADGQLTGGTVTEHTIREITAPPDSNMITWLLGHRWPEDFGRNRVELTGPEGAAVRVELSAGDKLRSLIQDVRDSTSEADDEVAAVAGNGNGHHA